MAFVGIYFDGPHVVIPDIVVLKTEDHEPGNEHNVEVVTQSPRDEVQKIKEYSEPQVGRCFTWFPVVIDSAGDEDQ